MIPLFFLYNNPMKPAIFLDRDGVIIQNVETYVKTTKDIRFIHSSLEALKILNLTAYQIVIISNQSAIGRGIITIEQAQLINQKILERVRSTGGRVDETFICPHAPEDQCNCRKPSPGLIFQAAEKLSLDLAQSFMIGDALTDIQAGQAAGIPINILVKTGRGSDQLKLLPVTKIQPFYVFSNLKSATLHILSGAPIL